MTETSTKKEIENLQDEIREKSDELDVNIQKLRNPRLVLFNIPEDITLGNVEETLTCQNPEQDINPLNAELNPICHLLALLGGATIVVISRLRVNIYALDSVVAKLHVIQTVLLPIIVQFGSIHNLDNRTGK